MFRSIVCKAAADHFQVLGVSRTCNDDDVRKAYLKLAKEWHPDVNKAPEASDKFKVISDAYENLKDEVRRSHYRAELQHGRVPGQYGQPGQYSPYQHYHGPYEHTDGRPPESFPQRIRNFFYSRSGRGSAVSAIVSLVVYAGPLIGLGVVLSFILDQNKKPTVTENPREQTVEAWFNPK